MATLPNGEREPLDPPGLTRLGRPRTTPPARADFNDDRHQAAPPVTARERNGTAWLTSRVPT